MSAVSGMVIVWTRLPLMMRRISMLSEVNAMMYGKAQTESETENKTKR